MAVLIKDANGKTVDTTKTSSTGGGGSSGFTPNDALKNKTVASQWDASQHQGANTPATIAASASAAKSAVNSANTSVAQSIADRMNSWNNQAASIERAQLADNIQRENERISSATTRSNTLKQEALAKQTARDALNKTNYDDWQNTINTNVANREARARTTMDERNAWAAGERDRRNAELDARRDARIAESEGKINDMYAANMAAYEQAQRNALAQGIQAQEEARANIARSYQTSANDLSTQYERNKRNLNMQALARGLNTGTGSQQQLALNQGYMRSYGQLRGEESAQNAGIDRAIANLKVNTENEIALALKQNDFQKAQALMDNYNNVTNWAEAQRTNIQNFYDQQYLNNQGTYDTMMANAQNYGDTMSAQNRSQLLEGQRFNQSTADTESANANNYLNSMIATAQSNRDASDATARALAANTRQINQNRAWQMEDTQNANERADKQQELQLKASFGDASAIEQLYGPDTANLYKQYFGMQNPLLGYANGFISGAEYKAITGQDPPVLNGNGGNTGGNGGSWGDWMLGGTPNANTTTGGKSGGATQAAAQKGREDAARTSQQNNTLAAAAQADYARTDNWQNIPNPTPSGEGYVGKYYTQAWNK